MRRWLLLTASLLPLAAHAQLAPRALSATDIARALGQAPVLPSQVGQPGGVARQDDLTLEASQARAAEMAAQNKANAAVPSASLGQPNGPAQLDPNGRASGFVTLPTGATIPASNADRAARIVDLNDYASVTLAGTDGAVTGTAFTSASTTFSPASVGEVILIRGAGIAGISFQTTIAAFVGTHAVTLAVSASTNVAGATFYHGQDATAGVALAFQTAQAKGAAIRGRGAFWLASQVTPMSLSGLSVTSDGGPTQGFSPYIGTGLTFLVTAGSSSPFQPGVGAHFGAAVLYPAQDGSAVTPLVYPPTFDVPTGSLFSNFSMDGTTLFNSWIAFAVEPGGGGGRLYADNTRMFCLSRCFDIRNGLADTIQTGNRLYVGPGVFPQEATTGAQNLWKYAAANAEVFHLDPMATGTNYPNVDGLLVNGGIIQSARYAVRLVSGVLDVSTISGLDLDSTPTALKLEGGATATMAWTGGTIYSSQVFAPNAANWIFDLNTSVQSIATTPQLAGVDLTVAGVHIPYVQGGVFRDQQAGLRNLSWTGNHVASWGQSGATPASTFYVISVGNNPIVRLAISGGTWDAGSIPASGNVASGLLTGNVAAGAVGGGLVVAGTAAPLTITGSQGAMLISGVTTIGTYGAKSVVNSTTGGSVVASTTANNFDKP